MIVRDLLCAYNEIAGLKKVTQVLSDHMEVPAHAQPGKKCRETEEWTPELQEEMEALERKTKPAFNSVSAGDSTHTDDGPLNKFFLKFSALTWK